MMKNQIHMKEKYTTQKTFLQIFPDDIFNIHKEYICHKTKDDNLTNSHVGG